jgi:hypothetical protein
MVKQLVGIVLVAVAVTFVVPGVVVVPGGRGGVIVPGGNVVLDTSFRDDPLDNGLDASSLLADKSLKDQSLDNLLAAGDWHGLIPWRTQSGLTQQLQLQDLGGLTIL